MLKSIILRCDCGNLKKTPRFRFSLREIDIRNFVAPDAIKNRLGIIERSSK